jgi:hypothetical protein
VAKGQAVASLLVQIGADISGLEQGGKQAAKSMQDLGKHARELGNKMAALGAAAVAAGAAMVASLTKAGLDQIDVQAKLARSLGSTIDGLRALQLASGEAGVSGEALAGNMQKFNQRLGEAQRGTGEAKKALDMLGLSAASLAAMDTDARIATVADRIRELGLSTSQTADVLRNFGIRGGEMVDFLRQGGDVIRAARDDVEAFGLSLSAIDAAKVEAANDAMGRIGLVMEGIKNQLAIAFAPVLGELADRFNNLAKENKGFGDQAIAVAEGIAKGFGFVGDVLHGLHVVIKGLQLVAEGFGGAFYSVIQGIMEAVVALNDAVARDINKTIGFFNRLGASIEEIPLMTDSEWVNDFRQFAEGSRARVASVRDELHELAMQEMPSDKIARFFDDVRARADEAANAVVQNQSGGGDFESTDEGANKREEERAKELEARREALLQQLNQVIEFAATEDEFETARHEERLETLRYALDQEMILEEEFQIAKQILEEKHQAKIAEIRKKGMTDLQKFTDASYSKQVGMISGYLADITAGVARENRAMFELNKAAGIANAVVSAYEGISKTLGAYPFPINVALAAAHAVAAFAQVRAIASQNFNSGGAAAPSLAGGTPATPVTPVTGGTPQSGGGAGSGSVLTVEGVSPDSLFSGRTVRALAERLAEHQRDGGEVVFA